MSPNHAVLEELYASKMHYWRGIAKKALQSTNDQDDAIQQGFVRCLNRPTPFNDLIHARRYLGLAIRHSAIDLARKNKVREKLLRPLEWCPLEQGESLDEIADF